jgi:hypothetical protein
MMPVLQFLWRTPWMRTADRRHVKVHALSALSFTGTVEFMDKDRPETDALNQEMRNIIEEARVILPGIQTLFGFQTIVVFNQRFMALPDYARHLHLIGLGLVIIAVALTMTPAVYYRYVGRDYVTEKMKHLSSRMIRGALFPLAWGISLDIFTVVLAVTDRPAWSLASAVAALILLLGMWFAFPLRARRRARRQT